MRILIVTHVVRKNDGQGRVNYEIVQAALAAGHSVTLLAAEAAAELVAHPRVRFVRAAWNSLASSVFPLLHGGTCIDLSSDETSASCGFFFGPDDPVRICVGRSTR